MTLVCNDLVIFVFILVAPSSPPQNLTVNILSSTEIQVNWTDVPEIDRNGIITEYEVMYEPLMTFGGLISTNTSRTNGFSIVLQDLQEYVEYNISVRAYTNDGPGPYSMGIIRRTFEDGELFIFVNICHIFVCVFIQCQALHLIMSQPWHCLPLRLE